MASLAQERALFKRALYKRRFSSGRFSGGLEFLQNSSVAAVAMGD
jgi:hypothetical protein